MERRRAEFAGAIDKGHEPMNVWVLSKKFEETRRLWERWRLETNTR